ncbi:PQQ-dependent sugar dehydrogenase [Nigerium massiliense]|uniref:PQQ-dependent sugar dehydrogenase n=1 Tax=Nigerium massiliense TaxID=1522317 RepID=UPI00058B9889|nr:PQQ-dependent sugar dehydrogenase [Nigerium massiliense]
MRWRLLGGAIAAALALTGCTATAPTPTADQSRQVPGAASSADIPGQTPSASNASPRTAPDGRPFVVKELGRFTEPWAMAFLPGSDRMLITQRSGALLLRDNATGRSVQVQGTPQVVHAGQGGLGDIVPGPTFADDNTVYLSWVEAGGGDAGAVVGRATLNTSGDTPRLDGLRVIWRQEPKVSGSGHFSHRIAFSPDGRYLFVSSGERQKFQPAQDLSNNLGKILRLNLDGTPAPGNPFAGRGGVSAQIYSYGHRNVLGLAFDADGRLWASEMGPQGGDEINLIKPGANYGWPNASDGSQYGGADIPDHKPGDGYEAPKVFWNPSISPGSLMIYSGDLFPQWRGDAFVGALSGQALIRVDLDGENATKGDQWDMGQRIRAVKQAPDGSIWILEDAPSGRLLQLTPPA